MAKTASTTASSSMGGFGRLFAVLAVLVGILAPIVYVLEQNLESFYIFHPEHLHDLSKRAITAHGNNTRAIVEYIVTELNEKVPNHVTRTEDWFFNNAGGAMGGVYIIHASE
jgi:C-8 sterol isomerase